MYVKHFTGILESYQGFNKYQSKGMKVAEKGRGRGTGWRRERARGS